MQYHFLGCHYEYVQRQQKREIELKFYLSILFNIKLGIELFSRRATPKVSSP